MVLAAAAAADTRTSLSSIDLMSPDTLDISFETYLPHI
jgi:hypothetical protein